MKMLLLALMVGASGNVFASGRNANLEVKCVDAVRNPDRFVTVKVLTSERTGNSVLEISKRGFSFSKDEKHSVSYRQARRPGAPKEWIGENVALQVRTTATPISGNKSPGLLVYKNGEKLQLVCEMMD